MSWKGMIMEKIHKTFRICISFGKAEKLSTWYLIKQKRGRKVCWDGGTRSGHEHFIFCSGRLHTWRVFVKICKLGRQENSGGKALTYSQHLARARKKLLEEWQKREQHEKYQATDYSSGLISWTEGAKHYKQKLPSKKSGKKLIWHKD